MDNPAGAQTSVSVSCPTGDKIVGGGEVNSSFDLAVNVNESYPSGNSWVTYANNAGIGDNTATVWAVCEKWSTTTGRYHVYSAPAKDNPSGAETFDSVSCPPGVSSLGGGASNTSISTGVNLNTTYPATGEWLTYTNNNSGFDDSVTPYVICGV
jgi:hypothetical protein